MRRGCLASSSSAASPRRAAAPGARFWMKTSARSIKPVEDVLRPRVLDVERQAFLGAVEPDEVRGHALDRLVVVAREIADLGPLDLDHARAEVGEVARGERRRHRLLQRDDRDAIEWKLFCHASLKRPRHAQHVLADVGEDQVGRDRRDLVEPRLAELALDVVLRREAEAPVGLQARVGRLPRRTGAEEAAPCSLPLRRACRRRTAPRPCSA